MVWGTDGLGYEVLNGMGYRMVWRYGVLNVMEY